MGAELYGAEPVFTATMDEFFAACGEAGRQLRESWLSPRPGPMFDDCSRAQPLLFAVGCALAKAVIGRGVRVDSLLGHSVGELAAAAVAGVFTVADGARIMLARSAAMARTVPGGMLAVAAGADELDGHLVPGVVVGAVNTPRQTVLSGPLRLLAGVADALSRRGFACHFVRSRQGFHSPICAGAAEEFASAFTGLPLRPPAMAIYSTHTGAPVTDEQATSGRFWAVQLASPVRFWDAADTLLSTGRHILFEAGPGGSCGALLRRHPDVRSRRSTVLALLPSLPREDAVAVFERSVAAAGRAPACPASLGAGR
jgi:acyl transferase domain-containing protein